MQLGSLSQHDLDLYFSNTWVKFNSFGPGIIYDRNLKEYGPTSPAVKEFLKEGPWRHISKFQTFHLPDPCPTGEVPEEVMCVLLTDKKNGGVGWRWAVPFIGDNMFETVFPETGFYDFKGAVILFSRRTMRQNKKGLHGHTASMAEFLGKFADVPEFPKKIIEVNRFVWTNENVNEMFCSPIKEPDEGFSLVKKGKKLAVTLTRKMCLSLGLRDYNPSLWLGKSYVGKMLKDHKAVIEVTPLAQEVTDELRHHNIEVTG